MEKGKRRAEGGVIKMALSQTQLVLQHLIEHGSITSYEAIQNYGATRLSAIIHILRHNKGYDIDTIFVPVTTRYGHKATVGKYTLRKRGDSSEQM